MTMPTKGTLRLLIVVEVLLTVGSVVASFLGESSLPEPLRTFEAEQSDAEIGRKLVVLFSLGLLLLIAMVVAWVGLFIFWRPARRLYLAATVLALLLTPFFGPYVETGLS